MKDVFFTILIIWVLFRIFGKGKIISFQNFQEAEKPKKVGEVTIDPVKKKDGKKNNDEGEYVDYEEIK